MQIGPQCWTCLGGRVRCDGLAPSCLTCKRRGVACAGYGEEARGGGIRSGRSDASQYTEDDSRSRSSRASSGATDTDLSEFTSDMILEPTAVKSPVFSQPVPALYRRAQMIFEGLDYCV